LRTRRSPFGRCSESPGSHRMPITAPARCPLGRSRDRTRRRGRAPTDARARS